MIYTANYKSPVGNILLASKDNKLIGLWIEEQKYYLSNIKDEIKQCEDNKILIETMIWLDKYFNKEKPDKLATFMSWERTPLKWVLGKGKIWLRDFLH